MYIQTVPGTYKHYKSVCYYYFCYYIGFEFLQVISKNLLFFIFNKNSM